MDLNEKIEHTRECLECAETIEEQEHFTMELDLLLAEQEYYDRPCDYGPEDHSDRFADETLCERCGCMSCDCC